MTQQLKVFLIVNKQWIMIHRDKTPALLLIEEGIFSLFKKMLIFLKHLNMIKYYIFSLLDT
ncbi:hypothetical protein AC621_07995 [Bacillus sp. FJAT-27445]|nr:hypothetical protein QF06_08600 [Bacillus sp. YP1]KMY48025.1 hypothetical protein AC621_07995 [Bacillus sp. FJAT-27445]MBG9806697.1 hypothetical protein [Bacillus subtilis]MUF99960.1 hypothetical protein [Bacillus tequilensis]RRN60500.1 hypothetical protein EI176_10735 [Bacillus subtilis subsp. subtilis]